MTRIKYSFYNTRHGEKIRYIFNKSKSKIVIIFLHGMMSDIQGKKVKFLSKFCKKKQINFLTFDLLGHGKSSGKFVEYGVNDWSIQANEIISNKIKNKKILLIGSSMGGWIGLQLLKKLNNVIGFIGIAAVIDFTKYKMWNKFSHKIKKKLKKGKIHYLKNNYGGSYPVSLKLITNSNKCLLINKKIKANFPIKLFIGKKDNIVTLKDTLDIYNILKTKNKEILVQNEGDHSLSKLKDLNRIAKVILSFF